MLIVVENEHEDAMRTINLDEFDSEPDGTTYESEGFLIAGDFMHHGILRLWHYGPKSDRVQGSGFFRAHFDPDQTQYRGVPTKTGDQIPVISDRGLVYLDPLSDEYLVISDYFFDERKPEHEKSMEKELTMQGDERHRVRYKGARGDRAYFESLIAPNEDCVPELGEGYLRKQTTAEFVFKKLIFHKR